MKILKDSIGMMAMLAAITSCTKSDVQYDLRMKKRDVNKPKPSADKVRKRKLQKQARKQNRK